MSIDLNRIVALSKTVEVTEDTEGYTAYAIAGVINKTLESVGVEDRINPQAVYNDSANGRVNGVKAAKDSKVRYNEDEVEQYAAKVVARFLAGSNVVTELPEPDQTENRQDLDEADVDAEELDDDVQI